MAGVKSIPHALRNGLDTVDDPDVLRERIRELEAENRRLRQQQERLRYAFDNMNYGVVFCEAVPNPKTKTTDFIIRQVNQGAERIEHLDRGDFIGRNLLQALPYLVGSGLIERMEKVVQDGEPALHQTRLHDKVGNLIHCHNDTLFRMPNGEVAIVYYDSTERAQTEEKLRRFAEAIEQSIDGIALVDTDGNLMFANRAFAKMHGCTVDEIKGKTLRDFHTPEQMAREVEPFLERALRDGGCTGELTELRKDGSPFPVYMSATTLLDNDGHAIGEILIARDVSKSKRTEQQLRILQAAVKDAIEGIMITDARLEGSGPRVVFVNEGFTRMTGYKLEEMIGQSPGVLLGAKSDREVIGRLRSQLQGGGSFLDEVIVYRADGSDFLMEWHISPVHDDGGEVSHFVAIQRDITQKRAAEKAQIVSEQMTAIAKMACTLNHEINNPLQAMTGYAEFLLRDEFETDKRDSLMAIVRNGERIATVIEKIESVSRPVFKKYIGEQFMLDLEKASQPDTSPSDD
ncbi:MAG: PAS domain S-box protein [Sumerlaeia bacterium]